MFNNSMKKAKNHLGHKFYGAAPRRVIQELYMLCDMQAGRNVTPSDPVLAEICETIYLDFNTAKVLLSERATRERYHKMDTFEKKAFCKARANAEAPDREEKLKQLEKDAEEFAKNLTAQRKQAELEKGEALNKLDEANELIKKLQAQVALNSVGGSVKDVTEEKVEPVKKSSTRKSTSKKEDNGDI